MGESLQYGGEGCHRQWSLVWEWDSGSYQCPCFHPWNAECHGTLEHNWLNGMHFKHQVDQVEVVFWKCGSYFLSRMNLSVLSYLKIEAVSHFRFWPCFSTLYLAKLLSLFKSMYQELGLMNIRIHMLDLYVKEQRRRENVKGKIQLLYTREGFEPLSFCPCSQLRLRIPLRILKKWQHLHFLCLPNQSD